MLTGHTHTELFPRDVQGRECPHLTPKLWPAVGLNLQIVAVAPSTHIPLQPPRSQPLVTADQYPPTPTWLCFFQHVP